MIIAITGVPASGKTTFAKKLAEQLNYTYINLHDYAKKYDAVEDFDIDRQCDVINIEKLPKIKDKTVIDGHFSHEIDEATICILCTCERKELVKRMRERKYKKHKILENLDVVNFHVIEDELIPIDIPKMTIDCTQAYKPDLPSIHDWLHEQ